MKRCIFCQNQVEGSRPTFQSRHGTKKKMGIREIVIEILA